MESNLRLRILSSLFLAIIIGLVIYVGNYAFYAFFVLTAMLEQDKTKGFFTNKIRLLLPRLRAFLIKQRALFLSIVLASSCFCIIGT